MRKIGLSLILACSLLATILTVSHVPTSFAASGHKPAPNKPVQKVLSVETKVEPFSKSWCDAFVKLHPQYAKTVQGCNAVIKTTVILETPGTAPNSTAAGNPYVICATCGGSGCAPHALQTIRLIQDYAAPENIWGARQIADMTGNWCDTPTVTYHDCNSGTYAFFGVSVVNSFCGNYSNGDGYRVAVADYQASGAGITSSESLEETMPWWMWNWTFTHTP